MNKNYIAALAALALLGLTAVPSMALGPPAGYVCPVGYSPTSYANACVNPDPNVPNGDTNRTYCVVGDVCHDLPTLFHNGRLDTLVYADGLCNQPAGCGCGHAIGEGLTETCTPIQVGSSDQDGTEAPHHEPGGECGLVDPKPGYRQESFINVCLRDAGDSPVFLAPSFGGNVYCIASGVPCPFLPGIFSDTGRTDEPVQTVYVEVLCNQDFGCGCGYMAAGVLVACTSLHD